MTSFGPGLCQIHGVALREQGRCFMCERDRAANDSRRSDGPRISLSERPQSTPVTVFLGLLFVVSIALTVLWFVSPEAITGLLK